MTPEEIFEEGEAIRRHNDLAVVSNMPLRRYESSRTKAFADSIAQNLAKLENPVEGMKVVLGDHSEFVYVDGGWRIKIWRHQLIEAAIRGGASIHLPGEEA